MEIAIYGGTVMMFAYDCRAATRDVDAIFHPREVVEPLIAQVAAEFHLPSEWMNSGVGSFIATHEAKMDFAELQVPGLMITRPTPEYLLAMKCMAARLPSPFRAGDVEDIRFLVRRLGIRSMVEIDQLVAEYYGAKTLEAGKRWLVEELIREVWHGRGTAT